MVPGEAGVKVSAKCTCSMNFSDEWKCSFKLMHPYSNILLFTAHACKMRNYQKSLDLRRNWIMYQPWLPSLNSANCLLPSGMDIFHRSDWWKNRLWYLLFLLWYNCTILKFCTVQVTSIVNYTLHNLEKTPNIKKSSPNVSLARNQNWKLKKL